MLGLKTITVFGFIFYDFGFIKYCKTLTLAL